MLMKRRKMDKRPWLVVKICGHIAKVFSRQRQPVCMEEDERKMAASGYYSPHQPINSMNGKKPKPPIGGSGQSNIWIKNKLIVYHYVKTPGGAIVYQALCGHDCSSKNDIITVHYLTGLANEVNCHKCIKLMKGE